MGAFNIENREGQRSFREHLMHFKIFLENVFDRMSNLTHNGENSVDWSDPKKQSFYNELLDIWSKPYSNKTDAYFAFKLASMNLYNRIIRNFDDDLAKSVFLMEKYRYEKQNKGTMLPDLKTIIPRQLLPNQESTVKRA